MRHTFSILLLLGGWATLPLCAAEPDALRLDFFEKKIRPVLVEHCYECHSADSKSLKGGLRLDTRDGVLRGGETGAAVVSGKPNEGLLLKALRYEDFEMPPSGRLPDKVIADFKKWIELGVPDPRVESASAAPMASPSKIDFEAGKKFWSFQSPQRHRLPSVRQPDWIATPIDGFVLAKLDEAGLVPSPTADRRTLIRRVSFDLIGLPPSPEEIETFVADSSPDAYERLVDRLLASPQYGERWARMWLDLMRFAEDQAHIVGNDRSLCFPNAYLYRDWVIAAFNADVPFDQFVKLQLAADLMLDGNSSFNANGVGAIVQGTQTAGAHADGVAVKREHGDLAALGFIGLGPKYYRRNAPEVMAEEWEDRVDVLSRGLLGLTVACARCHDHKFDPIGTEDYYALAGVFASTEMFNQPLAGAETDEKSGQAKKVESALHIVRDTKPTDLNVHIRGDVTRKGALVNRRFLSVLSDSEPRRFQTGSGRRELAESIADRRNPLTARVFVNRVWSLLIGRPLVGSPSNFGLLGQRPTHPELLDDLAVRFMDNGWSIKSLQREIVLSATYRQQSSQFSVPSAQGENLALSTEHSALTLDPENRLLSHMNRRRLDIEQWRDAVLLAAGRLNRSLNGPSIEPEKPEESRRTLYARISRLELNPLLARFDFPDPNAHSDRRVLTTTPLQKLFVLNSPFMLAQAETLVGRLMTEGTSTAERIQRAYALILSRSATEEELKLGMAFVDEAASDTAARWIQYAQVLLASNELLMLD